MLLKSMKYINNILGIIISSLLVIITISLAIQVFFRYVFNTGFIWTDELSRFALIWIVFLGAVISTYEKTHIRINFIEEKLPKIRNVIFSLHKIFLFIYSGLLIKVTIDTLPFVMNQKSANLGIPMAIMYSVFLVFSTLTILFLLSTLFIKKKKREGE